MRRPPRRLSLLAPLPRLAGGGCRARFLFFLGANTAPTLPAPAEFSSHSLSLTLPLFLCLSLPSLFSLHRLRSCPKISLPAGPHYRVLPAWPPPTHTPALLALRACALAAAATVPCFCFASVLMREGAGSEGASEAEADSAADTRARACEHGNRYFSRDIAPC